MNRNYKSILFVILFICFSISLAHSQENILTFRLVHPENDMLSHLPQSDVKVDKTQYECFMKGHDNYWINKKVELDANDIKEAKIEMEMGPANLAGGRKVEIPPEGFSNIDLASYANAFDVEIYFNQRGQKKLEDVTEKNIGRSLAVIFEGKLLMAPIIHEKILDGKVVIVGLFYVEAKRLKAAISKSLASAQPEDKSFTPVR